MILQAIQLSPAQKAVIEELVGRTLEDEDSISLCAGARVKPCECEEDHQQATDQMRRYLGMLDRAERRMSIEDCAAALLEAAGNKLSA